MTVGSGGGVVASGDAAATAGASVDGAAGVSTRSMTQRW